MAASCTCPEFVRKGKLCKHGAGLLIRVLVGQPLDQAMGEPQRQPQLSGASASSGGAPERFATAARDLSEALGEAAEGVTTGRLSTLAQRPRSSPARGRRARVEYGTMESRGEEHLWLVNAMYDAPQGLCAWLAQIGETAVGNKIECLWFTLDHSELIEALLAASKRGVTVRVLLD